MNWKTKALAGLEKHREILIFAPLYAWLSFINYALKVWRTPAWFSVLEQNHAALLKFEYTNNEQSRLLQFYVPELFHRVLGTTVPNSYALARLIFVFLTFLFFHRYLRKWFSSAEAFAGVALFAAITPFTHMNDLQESAPLLMLLFLLALQAIRDNRIAMLMPVFFVGGLTNETMMILPSVYFFYHLKFDRLKNMLAPAGKAFLIGIPLIVTLGPIRYFNRHRPVLGGGYHWPDNLQGMVTDLCRSPFEMAYASHIATDHFPDPYELPYANYAMPILFLAILGYYALFGYGESPFFLRRAAWMVPFFVLAHLITGKINEPRQMIPLLFILIPMAMVFLLNKRASSDDDEPFAYELR